MSVLVVNAGSSSLKYALVAPDGQTEASGVVDRVGQDAGEARHSVEGEDFSHPAAVADHDAAFDEMLRAFDRHGPSLDAVELDAVGHRVAHGADRFTGPVLVDDAVLDAIADLIPLAPLHNPANLACLQASRRAFGHVPQVAAFDTAFHHTLPDHAATYAVPAQWRDELGVRRYGFHGISHQDAARRAWDLMGRPPRSAIVVLHLGNGASACAVRDGHSVDTSMGMTPLEGLVMGTRPGDLDPGVLAHVCRAAGLTYAEVDDALVHDSGLRALAGVSDFRELSRRADAGDVAAVLARDVFEYRVAKYAGAYAAGLGALDAVVFTGAIGARADEVRRRVCERLEVMGVRLDPGANRDPAARAGRVSVATSPVAVFALEAQEEQAIAAMCRDVLGLTVPDVPRADLGSPAASSAGAGA